VETTFHKLRHYSATELIAAGVDIRTVAGRLGHGGGGTTTLKAYTAWVSEADQRAAQHIGGRMPERPVRPNPVERAKTDPQSPYERIARELRRDILAGVLVDGEYTPSTKQLAAERNVSVATVHRAMDLLKTWGLISSCRGRRATVIRPPAPEDKSSNGASGAVDASNTHTSMGKQLLDLEVRWRGSIVKKLTAEADPKDANGLRQLLIDAIRRHGRDESQIADYEMDVRYSGVRDLLTTFVASAG
jgi:integrase